MNRIPVIIDTDIGSDIDDTWALAMALGCPEIDVRMVVTCTGNTHYRAKIVCKFLERVGRTDIPVGIGLPFDSAMENQRAYVENYEIADYSGVVHEDGVAAMAKMIMQSEEEIILICIGPLPNIAKLLEIEPQVVEHARFVGMHGAVNKGYGGSDVVHAEFNVVHNVAAARLVFRSDFEMTITPLDSCGVVRLKDDDYRKATNADNAAMPEVLENYKIWLSTMGKNLIPDSSSILFDTVAIYLAFSDVLLDMQTLGIAVTEDGKTVIADNGKTMRVAVGWNDLPAFYDLLTARLLNAP